MSERVSHAIHLKGTNREFGLIVGGVLLAFGLYPLFHGAAPRGWAVVISIVLLLTALAKADLLAPLSRAWYRFGELLGVLVAPVVMSVVFFVVVTPTGLLLRLFGKDVLDRSFDPDATSYWVVRQDPAGSMKRQF